MTVLKTFSAICCSLILGIAGSAVAADGDIFTGGSSFSSEKPIKAKKSPILWSVVSIPSDIQPGDEFQVDCLVEAWKDNQGGPRKGAKGTAATFAIMLDVGSRTWDFDGLVGQGLAFKTKKDGTSLITTGPVTAGAWADNPSDNDTISVAATFNNAKKVQATRFYCEIIVGE